MPVAGAHNFQEKTPFATTPSEPNSSERWLRFVSIKLGPPVSRLKVTGKRKSLVYHYSVFPRYKVVCEAFEVNSSLPFS